MRSELKKMNILLSIIMTMFLLMNLSAEISNFVLGDWVYINNSAFSDRMLDDITGFQKSAVIDDHDLEQIMNKILTNYKDRGFVFVEVDMTKKIDEFGNLEVLCEIDEGHRVKIKSIELSGNESLTDKELKQALKFNKKRFFKKKFYTESKMKEIKESIINLYQQYGLDINGVDVIKDYNDSQTSVNLTFVINEDAQNFKETKVNNDELPIDKVIAKQIQIPEIVKSEKNDDVKEANHEPVYRKINKHTPQVENKDQSKRIRSLEKDLKNVSSLLKEREEVESLLSGLLTKEKVAKRELEIQIINYEERLKQLTEMNRLHKEQIANLEKELEAKQLKENELLNKNHVTQKKLSNVNDLIINQLGEIEKLRDHLSSIISTTRNEISKELDRIELESITVENNQNSSLKKTHESKEPVVVMGKLVEPLDDSGKLNGRIIIVNNDLGFVVLNLGVNKGAVKGMTFEIRRDGKVITTCRIIEVRKKISAADVADRNQKIKVNDDVYEIVK